MLSNIYNYRKLIWIFIKRDLSLKYAGSVLGIYWSIINPIITLMLYFIVFGLFLKIRLPHNNNLWDFALYFSSGFLPMTVLNSAVIRATTSILDNKNFIKKTSIPNEIFPVYAILSESIALIIGLFIFLIIFIFIKGIFSASIIFLPIAIALQFILTLSLGLIFSFATVYFRDIPQILNFLFMIWFWATPIVYTIDAIPPQIRWIQFLNPAYYLIEIYRDAIYYLRFPDLARFLFLSCFLIVFLFFCSTAFKKNNRTFGELL